MWKPWPTSFFSKSLLDQFPAAVAAGLCSGTMQGETMDQRQLLLSDSSQATSWVLSLLTVFLNVGNMSSFIGLVYDAIKAVIKVRCHWQRSCLKPSHLPQLQLGTLPRGKNISFIIPGTVADEVPVLPPARSPGARSAAAPEELLSILPGTCCQRCSSTTQGNSKAAAGLF